MKRCWALAGKRARRRPQGTVFLVAALLTACSSSSLDYRRAIEGIAHDIADLKNHYPQLNDFSVIEHLKADSYQISYGYHAHTPTGRGGWTSAVPGKKQGK